MNSSAWRGYPDGALLDAVMWREYYISRQFLQSGYSIRSSGNVKIAARQLQLPWCDIRTRSKNSSQRAIFPSRGRLGSYPLFRTTARRFRPRLPCHLSPSVGPDSVVATFLELAGHGRAKTEPTEAQGLDYGGPE